MGHRSEEPVVHTVTSATSSTTDDQDSRVRRYLMMQGIRVVCFGLLFVTSGWLRWAAIAGAVVLPYFAVVIANAVRPPQAGEFEEFDGDDDTFGTVDGPDDTPRIQP